MIAAYRLLAARMAEEHGLPFHLGVTEAGNGGDGRIKSAIGIGSLLEDGIGDTIRVSSRKNLKRRFRWRSRSQSGILILPSRLMRGSLKTCPGIRTILSGAERRN
jgi:hypothetical protein